MAVLKCRCGHSGPPGYLNRPKIECHEILFIYLLFIINYQPVHMLKTRIKNLSKCGNDVRYNPRFFYTVKNSSNWQ